MPCRIINRLYSFCALCLATCLEGCVCSIEMSLKSLVAIVKWCLRCSCVLPRMAFDWIKDQAVWLQLTVSDKPVNIIVLCGVAVLGYVAGKKVSFTDHRSGTGDEETDGRAVSVADEKKRLQCDLRAALEEKDRLESRTRTMAERINELTLKLSAEMSKKVAADESSVENVNIKNRPMNIADAYVHFCSNEWLEAKTVLDEVEVEGVQEVDKIQLLFKIFMISETEMRDLFRSLLSDFQRKLYNPTDDVMPATAVYHTENEYSPQTDVMPEKEDKMPHSPTLPLQITNVIGDFLRNQADNVKMERMRRQVVKQLDDVINTTHPNDSAVMSTLWLTCKEKPEVTEYITASLHLCWKMAIQRPPMEFKTSDEYLGDKCHDLFWKSDDPIKKKVTNMYHVFPMLYHGHSLMAKGQVYLVAS